MTRLEPRMTRFGNIPSHDDQDFRRYAKVRRRWRPRPTSILLFFALALVVGMVAGYLWLRDVGVLAVNDASIAPILAYRQPDNSVVLDRDGHKIGEYFDNYQVFVPYANLPPALVNAIVSIEDRHFMTHHGYDPRAIARALWDRVRGHPLKQGASTITQQVVRHFLLSNERSLRRKILEIALARELELRMSKERIFEIYANSMFLGNGAYGVGAAAWRYFGKPLPRLNTAECALIAGLFQSPSRYNPKANPALAKRRQQQVLRAMLRVGKLSTAEWRALYLAPLTYAEYKPLNASVAPWFIDYVRDQVPALLAKRVPESNGLRIYTTLDTRLESSTQTVLREQRELLESASRRAIPTRDPNGQLRSPRVEAAALLVNPHTGEILSMVGGRDYATSQFNRAVSALRSPGSAFKPAVYATALTRGRRWNEIVFVSPVTVNGNYRPRELGDDLGSETTLLRAFYKSMNNPTVELATQVGIAPIAEMAQSMGVESKLKLEAGLALGGSDVTMMDMARLYSTMASGGTLTSPIGITKITDRTGRVLWSAPTVDRRTKRVLTEQVAWLMTEGMRSVLQVGTGARASSIADFAVGKTGTSNESRDNWFCGYTRDLVAIVWVGTDDHAEITGATGGNTLALPIWEAIIRGTIRGKMAKEVPPPPRVLSATVHPRLGTLAEDGVTMWFIEGTEPKDEQTGVEALGRNSAQPYRNIFAQ